MASRPLRVKELAEFLAFDFDEGSTPTVLAEWRPDDAAHAVLSTCSSLLAVVNVDGFPVIQFAHFSVKEYLTSARLAETKDTLSRFYISMTPAHTIVAQACLGVLLHLDETVTKTELEDIDSELDGAIWFISLLTRVDGLVLMTPDLGVRGVWS